VFCCLNQLRTLVQHQQQLTEKHFALVCVCVL
jgi:hypothetical protein